MHQVILYTRPGCHLCHEMKHRLTLAAKELRFVINEMNIEDSPTLRVRYSQDIPVVMVNGEEAFRHRFDIVRLRRLLDAE